MFCLLFSLFGCFCLVLFLYLNQYIPASSPKGLEHVGSAGTVMIEQMGIFFRVFLAINDSVSRLGIGWRHSQNWQTRSDGISHHFECQYLRIWPTLAMARDFLAFRGLNIYHKALKYLMYDHSLADHTMTRLTPWICLLPIYFIGM